MVRVLFRARVRFSLRVKVMVLILLIQMNSAYSNGLMIFKPEFGDHHKHSYAYASS